MASLISAMERSMAASSRSSINVSITPAWMVEANTNRPYTTDQLIAVFRDRPVTYPAGTRWANSPR